MNPTRSSASKPRILVPLANIVAVPQLAKAAWALAQTMDADVHFVHVVSVPISRRLDEAEDLKREAEPLFAAVRASLPPDAVVRTEVRLGRLVGAEIRACAIESKASLMLVGWRKGFTLRSLVAGTLRPILGRPPCDVLVVDLDREDALRRLVPVVAGDDSDIGLRIVGAVTAARAASVLVHDRRARVPSELKLRAERIRSLVARLAELSPQLSVDVSLDAVAAPIHRLVERAGQALMILVTPFGQARGARVRPAPGARFERPLVVLVRG